LLFVLYNDGNSVQWVSSSTFAAAVAALQYDTAQNLSNSQQVQARQNCFAAPFDAMSHNGLQLNSACEINQVGQWSSSFGYGSTIAVANGASQISLDQWLASRQSTAGVFSLIPQSSGGPPGIPFFLELLASTATGAVAAGDYAVMFQPFEGLRWQRLAYGGANAQPVTISFWLWNGFGGGTFSVGIRNFAINRSYITNLVHNGGGWQYFSVTIPGDTAGTWAVGNAAAAEIHFCFMCGTTYQSPTPNAWAAGNYFGTSSTTNFFATSGNYVGMTGLTVHPGNEGPSAARSAFIMRPYDEELTACMRYQEVGMQLYDYRGMTTSGITSAYGSIPFRVVKFPATTPVINIAGTWNYWSGAGFAAFTPASFAMDAYSFRFQGTSLTNFNGWGNTGLWYANFRMI
jgi:hypothetical protein